MANMKITFFFRQGIYGFSETLWKTGTDLKPETYFGVADSLAKKRALLLGNSSSLKQIRIALEGGTRTYYVYDYPGEGLKGDLTQETSDFVDTRLLVQMTNDAQSKHRNHYLGGIFDSICVNGGDYVPSVNWTARFGQWVAALFANGWSWEPQATKTTSLIASVAQNVNGSVRVITEGVLIALPLPTFATIRIAQQQGAIQVNGPKIVKVIDGQTFDTKKRISIFPATVMGRASYATKAVVPIVNAVAMRIVKRAAGNVSYRSRGRQSA